MTVSRKIEPCEKLFVVISPGHCPIFFRCETKEGALDYYEDGFSLEEYKKMVRHAEFKVEEVTSLQQLLDHAPSPEFTLSSDTSF